MACLFTQINDGINSMLEIDEEQRIVLRNQVDSEILPPEVICTEKGINDDMYIPDATDEFESYRGTEFDELIVIHSILEYSGCKEGVSLIGINNYSLDSAK